MQIFQQAKVLHQSMQQKIVFVVYTKTVILKNYEIKLLYKGPVNLRIKPIITNLHNKYFYEKYKHALFLSEHLQEQRLNINLYKVMVRPVLL